LVEITRFGENQLSRLEAVEILTDYLNSFSTKYRVLEEEEGQIPMTTAHMQMDVFRKDWVNMGTRANLLKASTGYAFHAMAEDAVVQMEAVKHGQINARESRKKDSYIMTGYF